MPTSVSATDAPSSDNALFLRLNSSGGEAAIFSIVALSLFISASAAVYFSNSSGLECSGTVVAGAGSGIGSYAGAVSENSDEGPGVSALSTGGNGEAGSCCVVEFGGISSKESSRATAKSAGGV